jgi:hypothetical protein
LNSSIFPLPNDLISWPCRENLSSLSLFFLFCNNNTPAFSWILSFLYFPILHVMKLHCLCLFVFR